MSDDNRRTEWSASLEEGLLNDIVDIAERALRKPAMVQDEDIQKLAAAVIAHVRQFKRQDGLSPAEGLGISTL